MFLLNVIETGQYEVFKPLMNEGEGLSLRKCVTGSIESEIIATKNIENGYTVSIGENYTEIQHHDPLFGDDPRDSILICSTAACLDSSEFRIKHGNHVVGNAFTLSGGNRTGYLLNLYVTELALRDGNMRTRVKFLYSAKNKISKPKLHEQCLSNSEKVAELNLFGITIIREVITKKCVHEGQSWNYCLVSSLNSIDEPVVIPYRQDIVGRSIYDRDFDLQTDDLYTQTCLPGGITLLFPHTLYPQKQITLTMQLTTVNGEMIYQVDRKFDSICSYAIKTLELIEIGMDDSFEYPPSFEGATEFLK